jgi:hypothetical protein
MMRLIPAMAVVTWAAVFGCSQELCRLPFVDDAGSGVPNVSTDAGVPLDTSDADDLSFTQ